MVNVSSDECSEILGKAAKNIKMEKQQRSVVSLNNCSEKLSSVCIFTEK